MPNSYEDSTGKRGYLRVVQGERIHFLEFRGRFFFSFLISKYLLHKIMVLLSRGLGKNILVYVGRGQEGTKSFLCTV